VYFTFKYMLNHITQHLPALEAANNPYTITARSYMNKSLSIAVQGFGNVGSIVALEAFRDSTGSHKVVAVSDRNVTLYHEDGLPIDQLIQYVSNNLGDLPTSNEVLAGLNIKATILEREEILYCDADVLFLAA